MKQSQKNYLIQRLTGVFNEKRAAISHVLPPKLTAAEIRTAIKESGLKIATQAEFVDQIVKNGGTIPNHLTNWSGDDSELCSNYNAYVALKNEKHLAFTEERRKKQVALNEVYVSAKDKVMLGDDAEGALAILEQLRAFKV